MPGARDRDGLPDSIRFWKTKIEEADADRTFSIGLIYGPSGCGKSSMVKAGLLPRLSEDKIAIYLEATPDETESRLLNGLRKVCPSLDQSLGLCDSLAATRQGTVTSAGQKVLIVLDQFEQWLHAKKEEQNTDLVRALRQCDGGRLQCIVMVRDDFWLAVSRFLRELEVRLVEGENSALADLFDLDHACKVLSAFGRAFRKLPENVRDLSGDQKQFIQQSVAGLAEEGKAICVRLALFAEMMKGKSWNPETLVEVGGTSGVGVTFLEGTFSASTAPPEHRYHQKAARSVLKALLPDSGTDIKGEMKSREELLQASGYSSRPQDFDDLIRILDREVRLITPTDPEGIDSDEDSPATGAGQKYYQLTHDYLVHSLRDWLTRKQRETRRGRAELLLAERSATWNSKPENRQLPSTLEWLRIQALTSRSNWTAPQRKMMRRANRTIGLFWSAALALLILTGIGIQQTVSQVEQRTAQRNTRVAIDSLQGAEGKAVPFALDNLDELPRDLVVGDLQDRVSTASGQQKLSLLYGLARYDQVNIAAITAALVDEETGPHEVDNIVAALRMNESESLEIIRDAAKEASKASDWPTKARLAIVAMHLGDESLSAEMLRDRPEKTTTKVELPDLLAELKPPAITFDPIERTIFIREFSEWSGAVESLAKVVVYTNNLALRSGISLAVGRVAKPGQQAKESWQPVLEAWYSQATDSGTHSAAGYAMAQWQLSMPAIDATMKPPADRSWWLEPNGLTFVKIDSGNVVGGSPQPPYRSDEGARDFEMDIILLVHARKSTIEVSEASTFADLP